MYLVENVGVGCDPERTRVAGDFVDAARSDGGITHGMS